MKLFVVLCCVVYVSARKITFGTPGDPFAAFANDKDVLVPADDPNRPPTDFRGDVMKAKIVANENRNSGNRFRYAVETENGISVAQGGKLKEDGKTFIVHGSFSFTGADGRKYRTRYTADEKGYHPHTELEEVEVPDFEPVQTVPLPKPTYKPQPPPQLDIADNLAYLPPNNLYLPAQLPTAPPPRPPPPPPQCPPGTFGIPPNCRSPPPPPPPPQVLTSTILPPPPVPQLPPLLEIKSYTNPSRTYLPAKGYLPPAQNYGYY